MKEFLKVIKLIAKIVGCFFGITFIVYFFNLDMKATALAEPLIAKLQDKVERDNHL